MTIPAESALLYPLLMIAALWTGLYLRSRQPRLPGINPLQQIWIGLAAFVGAMLTAKLPFVLLASDGWSDGSVIFLSGKTILFGMVGGYCGVELAKWWQHVTVKTGDSFAVPAAGAIAVGRLACFAGQCCYGQPTSRPWACVFARVDPVPRHPTQLYEFAFHLLAAIVLSWLQARGRCRGQLIKLYFISYCGYRFASEFLRPEPVVLGGLTAYQWSALVIALAFSALWTRDARLGAGATTPSSL
jgi:phosphatidylglycerol:prolipoprotein diacylglycerol transferase